MIRWLERNGYDVSYFAGVDTAASRQRAPRARSVPLGRPRRVLVRGAARERRSGAGAGVNLRSSAATRSSGRPAGNRASTVRARRTARSSRTRRRTPTRRSIPAASWTGTWRDPALQPARRRRPAGERAHRHALHGQRLPRGRDHGPGRVRGAPVLAQHERRGPAAGRGRDASGRHARPRVGRGRGQRLPAGRPDAALRDDVDRREAPPGLRQHVTRRARRRTR